MGLLSSDLGGFEELFSGAGGAEFSCFSGLGASGTGVDASVFSVCFPPPRSSIGAGLVSSAFSGSSVSSCFLSVSVGLMEQSCGKSSSVLTWVGEVWGVSWLVTIPPRAMI